VEEILVPTNEEGVNLADVGWVAVFVIALIVCGIVSPWDSDTPAPVSTVVVLPTSAPPTLVMEGDPDYTASVEIDADGANEFDPFDPKKAVIRVSNSSQADDGKDGQLSVKSCKPGEFLLVWAPGYFVEAVACDGRKEPYRVTLKHLEAVDNAGYAWLSAVTECNRCHGNQLVSSSERGTSFDEMNEWFRSGHGRVFHGRYFESMYMGTSASGKPSQPARPVIIGTEWVPVPPERSREYHGPGFKLDFPQQSGNCAYCHVPASIPANQASRDLSSVFFAPRGIEGEGVTCDICHKVFEVILADSGLPFSDKPGVLSYRFLRPHREIFMTGPFSNVLTMASGLAANHRSTCAPVFSRSEFCAPCHYGKFGDMVIYNSFGEWRESPYAANPADPGYRTCQDCHMSHMAADDQRSLVSQRQACSAANTEFQNFDHNMMNYGPPGSDEQIPRMIQDAAEIQIQFGADPAGKNALDVIVTVTNTRAGHKFPTDSPFRHLILVVEAVDRARTPLMQVGGDQIPNWAGPGPVTPIQHVDQLRKARVEDFSGRAGKIFANLLVEEETNLSPGIAYWKEMKYAFIDSSTGQTSDNRLRPHVPDTSIYSFAMPDEGDVTVTVKLLYRFAFYDLLAWKEWFDRSDIIVAAWQCQGAPGQPEILRQSCKKIQP
jgi:cytochrome c553